MNIFISCGETSGDRYGASLVRALRSIDQSVKVTANGGDALKDSGAEICNYTVSKSTIGFIEPIRHLRFFMNAMKLTKAAILNQKIDIVIIIDHQGFNIPLAKWCSKQNIKVVSLFAPQFWMWGNRKQGQKFVQYCSLIATVFNKEYDFYKQIAADKTTFIGHPLLPDLPNRSPSNRSVLALFPGSRKQEISLLLPLMCEVAKAVKKANPDLEIKCARSAKDFSSDINAIISASGVSVTIVDDSRSLIAEATCSIVSSGTVTLEHALIGTPCVVIYKLKPLSYAIAHLLVMKKIREQCHGFIALPNILAKERIMPEFLQAQATIDAIEYEVNTILSDENYTDQMIQKFNQLREQLAIESHPFTDLAKQIRTLYTNYND